MNNKSARVQLESAGEHGITLHMYNERLILKKRVNAVLHHSGTVVIISWWHTSLVQTIQLWEAGQQLHFTLIRLKERISGSKAPISSAKIQHHNTRKVILSPVACGHKCPLSFELLDSSVHGSCSYGPHL